jgi:uncharacterized protein YggE
MVGVGWSADPPTPTTIEIYESAEVATMPDMANLSFAVETTAALAKQAVEENARLTSKVLEALKGIKGEGDEIKTTGFNLYPVYDKQYRNKTRPQGYRVNNTVVLETRGLKKLGEFIDQATQAGANRIGSLQFGSSKEDALRKKAAEKALLQGLETARQLAQAANLSFKRVLKISYSPEKPVRGYMAAARMESAPTSIEIGHMKIQASVNLVAELGQ